jgi:hypothetical protein
MATRSDRLRRISREKRRDPSAEPRPLRRRAPRGLRGNHAPRSWADIIGRVVLLRAALGFALATASLVWFGYRDASQREHGALQVEQWTDVAPADRPFARWLAEKIRDRAGTNAEHGEFIHAGVILEMGNPSLMNLYAWDVLEKNPGRHDRAEEALRWARRSVELSRGGPSVYLAPRLDTLARALFETGDAAGAIEIEYFALKLDPDEPRYADHLHRYGG